MRPPFIRRKKKIITALQIDSNWLRMVQIEESNRKKSVCAIIAKDIASLADEAIAKLIIGLSKEFKIDSHYLIISMPRERVISKTLELPSINPAEIKNMIDLQIGKQTPYESEEVIRDYQILETNADGYSRVLLVILRREIMDRHFRILESAGLIVERAGLSSEGLLNWNHIVNKQKSTTTKPYILVEVNYDTSDFEVVLDDKLIFGRSISLGSAELQGQIEQWRRKFIAEINQSIYAYQTEVIEKEIDKIVITGSGMASAILNEDDLKNEFGLSVQIIDQLEDISLTEEALNSYNNLINKNLSFCDLLGFSFTFGEQKIDLIPQEIQIERSVREKGRDLYLMGVLLVFILIAISGIFLGRIYNKERYLGQLKQRLLESKSKTDELNNMIIIRDMIEKRSSRRNMSLNLIYEVQRVISPEMHLISFSYNGEDSVTLRGTSNIISEVFSFVNKLEKSEYFQNVKTKYTTKHKVDDKEMTDFEILCPLADKYK